MLQGGGGVDPRIDRREVLGRTFAGFHAAIRAIPDELLALVGLADGGAHPRTGGCPAASGSGSGSRSRSSAGPRPRCLDEPTAGMDRRGTGRDTRAHRPTPGRRRRRSCSTSHDLADVETARRPDRDHRPRPARRDRHPLRARRTASAIGAPVPARPAARSRRVRDDPATPRTAVDGLAAAKLAEDGGRYRLDGTAIAGGSLRSHRGAGVPHGQPDRRARTRRRIARGALPRAGRGDARGGGPRPRRRRTTVVPRPALARDPRDRPRWSCASPLVAARPSLATARPPGRRAACSSARVLVIPVDAGRPVDFLLPGVDRASRSSRRASSASASPPPTTGHYGVLKRLGGSPLLAAGADRREDRRGPRRRGRAGRRCSSATASLACSAGVAPAGASPASARRARSCSGRSRSPASGCCSPARSGPRRCSPSRTSCSSRRLLLGGIVLPIDAAAGAAGGARRRAAGRRAERRAPRRARVDSGRRRGPARRSSPAGRVRSRSAAVANVPLGVGQIPGKGEPRLVGTGVQVNAAWLRGGDSNP